MKLLTKEIEQKFAKFPFESQSDKGDKAKVLVKYFGGSACTWLITEAEKQDNGDYLLYGYCDLGMGFPEWGYVMLSELQALTFRPFGLGVERELYLDDNATVADLI